MSEAHIVTGKPLEKPTHHGSTEYTEICFLELQLLLEFRASVVNSVFSPAHL